jgi:hypothetical protein
MDKSLYNEYEAITELDSDMESILFHLSSWHEEKGSSKRIILQKLLYSTNPLPAANHRVEGQ